MAIAVALGFKEPSVLITQMCKDNVSPALKGFKGQVGEVRFQLDQLITVDCPLV